MLTTQLSLIERISQRDPEAWSRLAATYDGLVRGYLRQKAQAAGYHHFDNYVDDVVQNVWIRLLSSSDGQGYQRSRGRFRAFLYTVTINALNDFFRRERRHVRGRTELPEADGLLKPSADDENEWDQQYKQTILNSVLEELRRELTASNPVRWESFARYALGHQPAAEVAAALGISVAVVYQHTSRNLKEIRERALAQFEEDPTA